MLPTVGEAHESALVFAASKYGVKPVASLAAHFLVANGHAAYRLLSAVRQQLTLDQLPAHLPVSPAHHRADPEERERRFERRFDTPAMPFADPSAPRPSPWCC